MSAWWPADPSNFYAWLEYGIAQGWISLPVCETHEGVPMSPDEEQEWSEGGDPCLHVLRLWPSKALDGLPKDQ